MSFGNFFGSTGQENKSLDSEVESPGQIPPQTSQGDMNIPGGMQLPEGIEFPGDMGFPRMSSGFAQIGSSILTVIVSLAFLVFGLIFATKYKRRK